MTVSNKLVYSPGPAPPEHRVLVLEPLLTPRLRMMRISVLRICEDCAVELVLIDPEGRRRMLAEDLRGGSGEVVIGRGGGERTIWTGYVDYGTRGKFACDKLIKLSVTASLQVRVSSNEMNTSSGLANSLPRLDTFDVIALQFEDRLCSLVVIGSGYGPRGPGFDYRCVQIIWEEVGLERYTLAIYEGVGVKVEGLVYRLRNPGFKPQVIRSYIYPTMEELSEQILFVMSHYALRSVIGFGVGVGANVLARFALAHPEKVEALCLVNCLSTQAGWIEWGYQKLNSRHLRSKGMTQAVLDYLMWHHFGRGTEERNHDLAQVYKSYFERHVNPTNLALFIDSYVRRTDLNITREMDPTRPSNTLGMPVMNITGALSPHVDDTIQDCGMVLEEQPGKVSEAFRLFLQGQGYVLYLINFYSSITKVFTTLGDVTFVLAPYT
uniref:Protein NDRG3 n=1 Tax=Timema douglasi TaxID=61478 RepID=A0A7R8VJT1_TIMDO|nr:unnamed protein product [Timema douglasi]